MSTTTTTELTTAQRLQQVLDKLNNRDFTVFFFVPDTQDVPSGAIIEMHQHALALQSAGYRVQMLTEGFGKGKAAYKPPRFLDPELQALPHSPADSAVQLSATDFLVVPDFYSALLLQTQKAAVCRIVFAQTYDYVSRGLVGGHTWRSHGVEYVMATSDKLKAFIEEWHGKNLYDIQVTNPGVPDYFKGATVRQPYVAIHCRNEADAERISKLFYLKYPHLAWISFRDLHGLSRKEYAGVLAKAACCVWVDRIAGFGQTPIEAMASGTPVIAMAPDVIPEYMVEHTGIWTQDFYQLPELVGKFMEHWLVRGVPPKLQEGMAAMAANYSTENTAAQTVASYEFIVDERKHQFTLYLDKFIKDAADAAEIINA